MLRNVGVDESSDELCDPSHSESPDTNQAQNEEYWETYKNNWISHNKSILNQEYDTWVKNNIEYNISLNQTDLIVDADAFS